MTEEMMQKVYEQYDFETGLVIIRSYERASRADIQNEQEWLAELWRKAGIEE